MDEETYIKLSIMRFNALFVDFINIFCTFKNIWTQRSVGRQHRWLSFKSNWNVPCRSFETTQINDEQLKTVIKLLLMLLPQWEDKVTISCCSKESLLNKISECSCPLLVETEVLFGGRADETLIYFHAPTVVFLCSDGTHYS